MSTHSKTSIDRPSATRAPRKSGLTDLQLALMGKGVVQGRRRLMTPPEAEAWANRRDARDRG